MSNLMFIELNELNFEFLDFYIDRGELPNFKRFFDKHGYVCTLSETAHERVNPWIQWVTAHTGLDYAEHRIFRMGDMYYNDHEQIWERLEAAGLKVGAIAPFNATNKTQHAAFFVPDPWMRTTFRGSLPLRWVYEAIMQVTDDYANNRIAPMSIAKLAVGAATYAQYRNVVKYAVEALRFLTRGHWYRALVADRLLGDIFIALWKKHRPDFASICLNAGAHLQHHYMFASPCYQGPLRNPAWWVAAGVDPVLESYRLYDEFFGDLQTADSDARIMLVSGLHQAAHERAAYYYRLDDHEAVFDTLGIPYVNIHPLMTEDFVVEYNDAETARLGQQMIESVIASQADVFYIETGDVANCGTATGPQAFYVDNRGSTLYVQLKPAARQLPQGLSLACNAQCLPEFDQKASLAQIKNGHHTGIGYFSDSGTKPGDLPEQFPLKELFPMILRTFGLDPTINPVNTQGSSVRHINTAA